MIKADNYSQELARTQKNSRAVSMERDSLLEKSQKLEAERDEARKALIMNLQTTGGMPWREWSAECAKETRRADENLERAEKAEAEVERLEHELRLAVMLAEEVADEWVDPDFCGDSPEFIKLRSRINQIKETLNPTDK